MQIAIVAALALLLVLIVLAFLLLNQLVMQNGRILLRLEALEAVLPALHPPIPGIDDYIATLPPGTPAPPFTLPDLNGVARSLAEWRGRRVQLVFVDPDCSFSRALLPSLAAVMSDVAPGRPVPVVVTTGAPDENAALFDEAGFTGPVLLQTASEVAGAYKVDGTPMSYLLDGDGTVVADIAVGVQAILLQAGVSALADDPGVPRPSPLTPPPDAGLPAGTQAPLFRLPRLGGGEVSLLDFRGAELLLVFADPECAPCEGLPARIATASAQHSNGKALIVSRGDPEANRVWAAEHAANVDVALQRHWEVSSEYATLAVPSAYIIDEWGTISVGLAAGAENVAALLSRFDVAPSGT